VVPKTQDVKNAKIKFKDQTARCEIAGHKITTKRTFDLEFKCEKTCNGKEYK